MKLAKLAVAAKTLLMVAGGVLLLTFPSTSAQTLSYIAGGLLTLWGAGQTLLFFTHKDPESNRFAQGTPAMAFGLYMILRPSLFGELIPALLSFGMLAFALRGVQTGIQLRRSESPHARMQLIFSAVLAGVAAVLLAVPFSSSAVGYGCIGAGYVLCGAAEAALWILRHRKKAQA